MVFQISMIAQSVDTNVNPILFRVVPQRKTALDYMKNILVPIENSRNNFGILLAENYIDKRERLELVKALYFRKGKNPIKLECETASIGTIEGLLVVETDDGVILPIPSLHPYTLCELAAEEYMGLKEKLSSDKTSISKRGWDNAVNILSERVNEFSKKEKGILHRQSVLVMPPGYADQEKKWYDMLGRLRNITEK